MVNKTLTEWAEIWGLSPEALEDLHERTLQVFPPPVVTKRDGSEAYTSSLVRLAAPSAGYWLTRNNVGVLTDKTGRPVRYGLANESKALNESIKSADLIGWRSVVITPEMVGQRVAIFTSVECKKADWRPGEDPEREAAQSRWAAMVMAAGGEACFSTGGLPE